MTRDQLAIVWMSAFAFNMGIAPRPDRDPASVEELAGALRAMRDLFDIRMDQEPGR